MAKPLHKIGSKVTIFQLSPSKGLFVEGVATVREVLDADMEHYMVEFKGDHGQTYERFIDRDGQTDPQAYIKTFNARIGVPA